MNNIKMGVKLIGGFAIVSAIVLVVGLVSWSGINRLRKNVNDVGGVRLSAAESILALKAVLDPGGFNAMILGFTRDHYAVLAKVADYLLANRAFQGGEDPTACNFGNRAKALEAYEAMRRDADNEFAQFEKLKSGAAREIGELSSSSVEIAEKAGGLLEKIVPVMQKTAIPSLSNSSSHA
jgi:hypothetical protein